jgi:hypothetical protein
VSVTNTSLMVVTAVPESAFGRDVNRVQSGPEPLASITASSLAQKCTKNARGSSSRIWIVDRGGVDAVVPLVGTSLTSWELEVAVPVNFS